MRGDEKYRYVRLKVAKICDYLKARDVSQKEINDTESEIPVACLFDSILAVGHKHHFIAVRLEHNPERVTY